MLPLLIPLLEAAGPLLTRAGAAVAARGVASAAARSAPAAAEAAASSGWKAKAGKFAMDVLSGTAGGDPQDGISGAAKLARAAASAYKQHKAAQSASAEDRYSQANPWATVTGAMGQKAAGLNINSSSGFSKVGGFMGQKAVDTADSQHASAVQESIDKIKKEKDAREALVSKIKLTITGFVGATIAATKLSGIMLENARQLRRFDGSLAGLFARMDRQALILQMKTAGATSSSTTGLGENYMALQREMTDLRNAATNISNSVASGFVYIARAGVWVANMARDISGIKKVSDWWFGKKDAKEADGLPFEQFLKRAAAGDFGRNKPPKPKGAPP